jgi:ribosomal protein L37AE/L43A
MIHLKACPKCGGDVYLDRDLYGAFMACFQCGHTLSGAEERKVTAAAKPVAKEKIKANAG